MQNRSNRFGFAVFSWKGRRSRKSEVRSQKSELRSQKSEVGTQKSEVGSQKSELGRQNSELRSQPVGIRDFWKVLELNFRNKLCKC